VEFHSTPTNFLKKVGSKTLEPVFSNGKSKNAIEKLINLYNPLTI